MRLGRFRHADYVELTMHFLCNLRCVHCMIEGTMDRLAPESDESFTRLLEENRCSRRYRGLILTGSEITLRRDLPELARRARASGFDHVRIQTHGMRLSDERYCRELLEAGVDEYFVSVTAADAETHDAITEVPGSFDKLIRGLENLEAIGGATLITNTVVTERSYRQLPAVVERLSAFRSLVQMEFWNFWPMDENDTKGLIASHLDVLPPLREAIARARMLGLGIEVKNFPECLLGSDGDALDNTQSRLEIDPDFWSEFERNGFGQCVHREYCSSTQCLGLNTAYVRRFGWLADVLVPLAEPFSGEEAAGADA